MMNGKQRYRCKTCGFNFTTGFRGKPMEVRQQALKLYLEGLGFRAIGRELNVSNVTVLNWVRAYGLGARPKTPKPDAPAAKKAEGKEEAIALKIIAAPASPVSSQEGSS
jgi:transposase-like protein